MVWQHKRGTYASHTVRQSLRAFATALLFSAISFLPWLHLFDAAEHADTACRACTHQALPLPVLETQADADGCWICQSLSVLMPTSPTMDHEQVMVVIDTIQPVLLMEPCAPVFAVLNPACPSHAPPFYC